MKIGKKTSEQLLEEATYTLRLENGIKMIFRQRAWEKPKGRPNVMNLVQRNERLICLELGARGKGV